MSDLWFVFVGLILVLVPVFNHTVKEINKPREISYYRHYNEKNELTGYYIQRDDNIEVMKSAEYNLTTLQTETFYAAWEKGKRVSDTHNFTELDGEYLVVTIPVDGNYSIKNAGMLLFSEEFPRLKGDKIVIHKDAFINGRISIEKKAKENK